MHVLSVTNVENKWKTEKWSTKRKKSREIVHFWLGLIYEYQYQKAIGRHTQANFLKGTETFILLCDCVILIKITSLQSQLSVGLLVLLLPFIFKTIAKAGIDDNSQ